MFRTNVQNDHEAVALASRRLPSRADVAILGGGLAGLATALRLQAAGLSTVVVESHGHAGGCAGYFRHRGFSFDVGATTLVDFEPGGVGAELLEVAGLGPLDGQALPGYRAWLPDRTVTLHRDQSAWRTERLRTLGATRAHHRFWALLDDLAETFWAASRAGVRLPMTGASDVVRNARALGLRNLPMTAHIPRTLGGALRHHGLRGDTALVALLGMLVEDTVHASVDDAPLVNAALGITIRGAGLSRHRGGMHGFWQRLVRRYRELGGHLQVGCRALAVHGDLGAFEVVTTRGRLSAGQVVSALPAATTAEIAHVGRLTQRLRPYLERDRENLGGAVVVFLGVPDGEVAGQNLTHHQVLRDYSRPLGDGNNMFVSVSAPNDRASAPPGHRAVMISTHTDLPSWEGRSDPEYAVQKEAITDRLIENARAVYPTLGRRVVVRLAGTPRTYAHFTRRPRGAVGGVHQSPSNSNQHAVPHSLGERGFWLVGDSTWPGLGTVACVIGSRIVAEGVVRTARSRLRVPVPPSRGARTDRGEHPSSPLMIGGRA
jgi:C-3',4' desaturase CrtD